MSDPVMMTCGHAAQGTCSRRDGNEYDPPIPACVTCDCVEIATAATDLTGRMARCDYFGRGGFRNHGPIYGGGTCSRARCGCIVPSDAGLPFFGFRGDGSKIARDTCECGANVRLHWPRWRAEFKVVRRWFKIERYEETRTEEEHMPDAGWAAKWAEKRRMDLLKMGDGPSLFGDKSEPTKVFSVDLLNLKEIPKRHDVKACGEFSPAGAAQYDSFFCGCAGWN